MSLPGGYSADELMKARRDLVRAVALLTFDAVTENTLSGRNIMFHAEELMKWIDAFYSGQEPGQEGGRDLRRDL
jgi:hypothetical protein